MNRQRNNVGIITSEDRFNKLLSNSFSRGNYLLNRKVDLNNGTDLRERREYAQNIIKDVNNKQVKKPAKKVSSPGKKALARKMPLNSILHLKN